MFFPMLVLSNIFRIIRDDHAYCTTEIHKIGVAWMPLKPRSCMEQKKTVPASFHLLDGWMVGDIPHIYQHLHQDDPFTIYQKMEHIDTLW